MIIDTSNKKNLFKVYVNKALGNVPAWNKKVKKKGTKYTINKKDSNADKLLKIYRYANQYEHADFNNSAEL